MIVCLLRTIVIVHRLILCLRPRPHTADIHALALLVRSVLQLRVLLLLMGAINHLIATVGGTALIEITICVVLRWLILPVNV